MQLNWNQRFRDKKTKLKIEDNVVHTTARQEISRRQNIVTTTNHGQKDKNDTGMKKNENCTCKACKTTNL